MRLKKHILHVLCLVLVVSSSWAQSEDEVRENADKLFEKEAYVEATPLYLQLLNLYPTDPEINFKYGTCSLFNDDKEKKDAIKFLNVATKSSTIDPRAFYFKGKALHLNYQFDEAKKFYKIYQSKRAARDDRYDVDREIEMCQNGKKLMIQFTDIVVSEKTQISEEKFFRLYKDMQSIGGNILVTERFQSKLDKKRGHVPIVHYPKDAKAVYYSSYGENGKTGLDIYVRKRLPNNEWGEPYRLTGEINTEYDEDFPYLHPNGRYLYFSSKGHNSMGGFDVFLARYNPDNNQFQGIENVDFAISSPDDDLFYVVDAEYQNAYFASSRQSEQGKLHVYQVKVIRIPIQEVIVMGDYTSEVNPDNKDMTIYITSASTGSEVGKIMTNEVGKYSYVFPKGGKYNLEIQIDGLEPITKMIDLPFLDEFRPLKQKVVHYMEDGAEKVKIINLFDEEVEGGEALVAQVLREKSSLEVNIDEFDEEALRKIELEAKRDEILAELNFNGMSIREVQNQLDELATADTKKAEQVQKLNMGISDAYIGLSEEIEEITSERDDLIAKASNETDPAEKYKALIEAQKLDTERTKLLEQAAGLTDLGEEIERKFGSDDPSNSKMSIVEAEFNRLIEEGNEEEALNYLAQQKEQIEDAKGNTTEGMIEELVQETIDQRQRQDELASRNQAANREIEKAKVRKVELESKLPNAKKKEAARIREELDEIENTIKLYRDEQQYNQNEIVEIDKSIAVREAQVDVIQSSGESVLKEIDQRKYNDAQAAIAAQQAKDRADELSNQIAQLESSNPEVSNPSIATAQETDQLIRSHTDAVQQIETNESDQQTQIEALIAQNEQTLNSVEQQLKSIENELVESPNDENLLESQAKLNEFKEELENKQSQLGENLAAIQPETTPTVTSETVLADIAPDYTRTQRSIETDESLTEVERLKALQQNDQALQTSLEQKLSDIQGQLETDPTNSTLLEELKTVNELVFDTNEAIEDRAVQIDQIENQAPAVVITKEDLIAEVSPNYENDSQSIEANASLSEVERLKALQQNDQALQTSLEQKLSDIQEQLETNPTDPTLLQELQAVNELLSDTNEAIEDRATRIDQIENQAPAVAITKEDLIAELSPNYQDDVQSIETNTSLSEVERLEALNEADQSLVRSVENRIDEIDLSLSTNPANTELVAEKQALEGVLSELNEDISQRNNQVASLNASNTSEVKPFNSEETIAELLPNYQSDLSDIEANENLSDLEKLEAKQALETRLMTNLSSELKAVQDELANDPSNEQLKIQEKGLSETITVTQAGIDERAQEINALSSAATVDVASVKQAVLDEVKEGYQERLQEIEAASGPEVQRSLDRLELEQEVLSALREKEQDARAAVENETGDEQAKTELSAIEQLVREQETTVEAQRTASLEAAKSAQVYEETIAGADRKYSIDIGDLTSEANPSSEKIAAREVEFQENLQAELDKKQKSLDRKYSVDVDLESLILENEIEESKRRQQEAENATKGSVSAEGDQQEFISELREAFISVGDIELESANPTLEEARDHETQLRDYLNELQEKKSTIEDQLEENPSDEALQNQLSWIEEEEAEVERAIGRMEIIIGDLESTNVTAQTSAETDAALQDLETKRSELVNQLNDPNLSSSERKDLNEELNEVDQARLKRTNELQSETIVQAQEKQDNLNNALQRLGTNDPETTEVKSALAASEEERKAIDELLVQSDEAKSEEERNYLLSQAEERQEKLNTRLERVVENREIQNIEEQEGITLLSREELEKRRRNFIIEIGDLEVQQDRVESAIETAKKKEIPALIKEKSAIDAQLDLLRNQLEHIEARIENFDQTEPVDRMATVGLEQEITFTEEREIAASDAYKSYREEGVKALEIENELRTLQLDLDRERAELMQLISSPESPERNEQIELKTASIKQLESDIQLKSRAFDEQMAVADRLLPSDEQEAMKIKNLLVRGVQPIKTAVVATALVQMPTAGFAIDPNAESIYTEENPIPVGVKNPSGMTYRVQIGAFAKPIPQDLFKEFNPVSGEKIVNTNITRYMAGFFSSSESVVEARQAIRALGYSDAFVVAYCDGERISFGKARRMEASGECVPKGTNQLVMEVAENTAEHLGIPTENELVELPEYSYNQAPGATEADPIELKQGLFFTVQIGVFNRPVGADIVKNLPEIMTVRLPNGLIRYATGMFDSAEDAQPRRRDAINRGIKDAFIVAYYKGERLTVGRARRLLAEKGPSILQSNLEKKEPVEVVEVPENAQRTDSVSVEVVEAPVAVEKDERKVQIVTKKTFDEFPRDVLNRYNTEGNFYYDESDGKVKSEIYSNKRELPRLFKFEKDIDTVYLSIEDVQNERDKNHIFVKLSDDKVPGDLADWLLRMGYQKKFIRTDEGLELHIEGIEPNGLQDVQYRIREVGLEPVLVELEEEIEDN